ncbi:hypothetical protein Tco_1413117, partial [Tanacetum coccineum]
MFSHLSHNPMPFSSHQGPGVVGEAGWCSSARCAYWLACKLKDRVMKGT